MWRVVERFHDLQDRNFLYRAGDTYPRPGLKVTEARIKSLSGTGNRRGIPLIEEVPEDAGKPSRRAPVKGRRKKDVD